MISFDFAYHKPSTIEGAVSLFQEYRSKNKTAFYYGGGTEFISRARMNEIKADAIIDLKGISECNEFKKEKNNIIIGSAITLTNIAETNLFPLLSNVSRLIATHTERNKITIGGNISSNLLYKEAILPFLLAGSELVIAGEKGVKKSSINHVFQNGIQLKDEEFIVQIITNEKFTKLPHSNCKRTKHSKVNYPIVSLASLQVEDQIRLAISGVCEFPFRLEKIETEINDSSISVEKRIENAMQHIPTPILDDMHASKAYRKFVLENELKKTLENMEGVSS